MRVHYKFFRGTMKSWDELFGEAADFATEIGAAQVINVSHAVAGQDGTVTVWYWTDEDSGAEV